jgi:hypothetical protein
MPLASYRSFMGIAKDTLDTYLSAGVAAGATSVPVNGTVIPAASTIFFLDGANSESRAVTAGGGTSTLTVAALTNAHSVNTPIYAQLTASLGPTSYIPLTALDYTDTYAMIDDTGIRGSNTDVYGSTQAAGHADITLGGDLIPDMFGYLLGGAFGAVDFAAGTPNTHTFAQINTAASQGQPTPFLIYIYQGTTTRVFAGAKISELVLKIDPSANITWTAKATAFTSILVSTPTPSYSALQPQAAWQVTPTIGGTSYPNLLSGDVTFKRATVDAINTADSTQAPYKIWVGPLQATGNMLFVMEDETLLTQFLANTQPVVSLAYTNGTGASQTAMTIQMTKAAFLTGWKPTIIGKNGYVELGGPIKGLANTTDANTAGGGYSPARVVLKNAVASGQYQ